MMTHDEHFYNENVTNRKRIKNLAATLYAFVFLFDSEKSTFADIFFSSVGESILWRLHSFTTVIG